MEKLSLKDIQNTALEILIEFDCICRDKGFRYSLAGGTLIGAVRNKGFIPWDDDIDVIMPRPDYELFQIYCSNNNTPFTLFSAKTAPECKYLFTKLTNKSTVIQYENNTMENSGIGVFIDVFPIDGLGNSYSEAKLFFRKIFFLRYLRTLSFTRVLKKSTTRAWYFEPVRLIMFLLSRMIKPPVLTAKIENCVISRNYDDCSIVGSHFGSYGEREILRKEVFTENIEVEFEGHFFKALKSFDQYLTAVYGDYKKLPEDAKEMRHHSFTAFGRD